MFWTWIRGLSWKKSTIISSKKVTTKNGILRTKSDLVSYEYITAISQYLTNKGVHFDKSIVKCDNDNTPTQIGNGVVKYRGYKFVFGMSEKMLGDLGNREEISDLVIYHNSGAKINNFVKKCVKLYENKTDLSYKQKFYGMTKSNGQTVFSQLSFGCFISFDDVFFPEKKKVVESVDELLAGRLRKLSFILHGEPGCGKSSIIKALAHKTGYSVVEIRLSLVENDDELRNLFFAETLPVLSGSNLQYPKLLPGRRIFIFEDVDADSDIVFKREELEKNNENLTLRDVNKDNIDEPKTEPKFKKQKLTLSGILNVLDGLIEIDGSIVVITTNHYEKLDPAFTRYGRVTYNLNMRRLTSECARALVQKFHPTWDGHITSGKYTPAELEAICQTNSAESISAVLN